MSGMIRFFAGFMLVFGAVGTLEVDPDAGLLTTAILATIGLVIMAFGVAKIQQQND
jgi:hypothetical protein